MWQPPCLPSHAQGNPGPFNIPCCPPHSFVHRLSLCLVLPTWKCICCSSSAVTQATQGTATVILLPQPLWVSGAWLRGRCQAVQTVGDLGMLSRSSRTMILYVKIGRDWVSLSASKVRQSLSSLCGSFGLRCLKVPSVLCEKHHGPIAVFRRLWTSLALAPTRAFVLLTSCFVKSFSQMV